jgi:hypothetical protein
MGVLDDPRELGRRISAARGYLQMQRPEFARGLGISVPTLRRMEEGDESALGRSVDARREKANMVLGMEGLPVPEEIIGIVSFRLEDRIDQLENKIKLILSD